MKIKALFLVSVASAITAAAASAAPAVGTGALDQLSLVQPVASWQYHRNCGWQGGTVTMPRVMENFASTSPKPDLRSWGMILGKSV